MAICGQNSYMKRVCDLQTRNARFDDGIGRRHLGN